MRQRRNLGLTAWSLHLQSQLSLSIEWMRGSLLIPRLMPCMSKSQPQRDGGETTLVVSLVSCCGRELKSWPHSAASEAIVWYEMGAHFASISSLYLEPPCLATTITAQLPQLIKCMRCRASRRNNGSWHLTCRVHEEGGRTACSMPHLAMRFGTNPWRTEASASRHL